MRNEGITLRCHTSICDTLGVVRGQNVARVVVPGLDGNSKMGFERVTRHAIGFRCVDSRVDGGQYGPKRDIVFRVGTLYFVKPPSEHKEDISYY